MLVCVAVLHWCLCWQVFVANPNKPDAIVEILTSNKDKLLKYLGDFHTDKGELALSAVLVPNPSAARQHSRA